MNREELSFAVFCIEWVADALKIKAGRCYELLTEESTLLYDYIIPSYEALHTQGKEYIVREITDMMREKGVIE